MLKSSSFESAVKKKKKRKLVILQNREDSPKGKKNSSCRKLKPQSPRGETSCLPNGGSTLKNTNSTNKGRSVIGTVGSCQSASFLRERKKRKEGGREGGGGRCAGSQRRNASLSRRSIMGANPPRLDLETRRGPPLVLEFVSFEIYTSLDKNYGLFPETLTNRRRVDRHSSRYWRINLSWWCFYTETEYVCCPGFQVLRFQE